MQNRFPFAALIFCFTLAIPASATTVYVYERPSGTRIITNQVNNDKSLKLLKRYQPRSRVESLARPRQNPSKRSLNPRETKFDQTIFDLADKYRQDRALIKAIVQIESSFNPWALSPKGAQGLMQLMPATANDYNVKRPFDVDDNLRGGIEYFAHLMNRYDGNIRLALAAYNAGEGAVAKYKGIPPYPETETYIEYVLRLHKNYQSYPQTYS